MKQTIKTILGLLVAFVVTGCSSFDENHLAICGGEEVRIVDMSKSEGRNLHEVWSWRIDEPTEGLPAEYSKYLMPLDECKFVDGNRKLLLTSSHSAVVLLDIKSRKCDFYARVPMAHSADLLPNNRIAVALSTIFCYDTKTVVLSVLATYFSGMAFSWMLVSIVGIILIMSAGSTTEPCLPMVRFLR